MAARDAVLRQDGPSTGERPSPGDPGTRRCSTCGESYPGDYSVCPRDATPLGAELDGADPLVGQTVGDTYDVLRKIGEGGMGRVYEVRHRRLGRSFALKMMHTQFASDHEAVTRFRREATAVAQIHSPFVTQVFDVHVTSDGRPYFVSELLAGEDLAEVLDREHKLDVARAVDIVRQISRAAAAAHAAGVVHRDLKPENVMIVRDPEGRPAVKVLDFGIAKTMTGGASLTRTGVVMGTPSYMAPEQASGSASVDHRADIYAVGAILYRLLTGRAPHADDDDSEDDIAKTLSRVIHDDPERPKTLRRDLPDALELVIQRAMARRPDDRYQSMSDLDQALSPFDQRPRGSLAGREPAGTVLLAAPVGASDAGRAETLAVPAGTIDAAVSEDAGRARAARPRLVAFSVAVAVWTFAAVSSLVGDAVRAITGEALAVSESVLSLVIGLALTVPLGVWWARRVAKRWRNTVTAVLLAAEVERVAWATLATYAATLGLGELVSVVVVRAAAAPAALGPLAWVASLVAAGVTIALAVRRKRL